MRPAPTFAIIPNELMDEAPSETRLETLAVCTALQRLAIPLQGGPLFCIAKPEEIAAKAGVDIETSEAVLEWLMGAAWVVRYDKDGWHSVYELSFATG